MSLPRCIAHYIDTYFPGPVPGCMIERTAVLLSDADTGEPIGACAALERVVASPPWPGASDDEGADDET